MTDPEDYPYEDNPVDTDAISWGSRDDGWDEEYR